jgi:hypothetical protein
MEPRNDVEDMKQRKLIIQQTKQTPWISVRK